MRAPLSVTLGVVLVAALVAGCGKSAVNAPGTSTSGTSVDQAEVAGAIASSPAVVEDGEFDSTDPSILSGPGGTALISPLRFWRTITQVDRRFEFAFSDTDSTGHPTQALVTIRKRLLGRFNILVGVPGSDSVALDSALNVIHKPLEDHWVRHLLLRRMWLADHDRPVWRIVATSAVRVTSRDATTQLQSLRVQSGSLDTTLTDPARLFALRRILRFDPNTPVTLTATTLRNDDVVVLQLRDHRLRFHNNGDNTYTGVWTVGALDGPRHFGVNALSYGTLFDDAAAYDSEAWLVPFLVRPSEIAAELP